jgi:hypothetical protein
MAYAKDTTVSVEKTEAEIKAVFRRYGATAFASMEGRGMAIIAFEMKERRITFKLPLPQQDADEFKRTPGKQLMRSNESRIAAWEQACRSRWRALFLCIKAKLESVEAGIETFEDAFLAHIQMPDGLTVGEHTRPMIARAYETGTMQPLLPSPGSVN